MQDFAPFGNAVAAQVKKMTSSNERLFVAGNGRELWDIYLASFPEGTNPIFITRTEHDCNCCKGFVRNMGNMVSIKDGIVTTVWDVDVPFPYNVVAQKLASYVRNAAINDLFASNESSYGKLKTIQIDTDAGKNMVWNHFSGEVGSKNFCTNPDTRRGDYRAAVQVAGRSLKEVEAAHLDVVIDLIESNSIYRGQEFLEPIKTFKEVKAKYDAANDKKLFIWENATQRGVQLRRSVIGSLFEDLAEGKDLEKAVASFETKVAPTNYKRPKPVVTKKMIDEALSTLEAEGLVDSLDRRHAVLGDLNINDVIYTDSTKAVATKVDDLRSSLYKSATKKTAAPVGAGEMSIHDFLENVVPTAKKIEIKNDINVQANFVTLTAPVHADAEGVFSWDNGFAWSYDGNVTDSYIKEKVGKAGGNIKAPFRVSLSWENLDDLDISCMVGGERIYFGNKAGVLDVDMNVFSPKRGAVENLSWSTVRDGVYHITVNNYHQREHTDVGYSLEVEFNGAIYQYRRDGMVPLDKDALVITIKNGQLVSIKPSSVVAEGASFGVDKWNLAANDFHMVSAVTLSPNFWGENKDGNQHWFFFVQGCENPEPVRGIYNEYLKPSLLKHKRAFELLGSHTMCQPTKDQLSGIGFSSTKPQKATFRVDGGRVYTVKF